MHNLCDFAQTIQKHNFNLKLIFSSKHSLSLPNKKNVSSFSNENLFNHFWVWLGIFEHIPQNILCFLPNSDRKRISNMKMIIIQTIIKFIVQSNYIIRIRTWNREYDFSRSRKYQLNDHRYFSVSTCLAILGYYMKSWSRLQDNRIGHQIATHACNEDVSLSLKCSNVVLLAMV